MGKKDKKRKSSVSRSRSRRRDKKEKKKAEKKRGAKEERRRRKEERSESSSSKGKAKAKESESSEEVERNEPVKSVKETPVEPVTSAVATLDVPLTVSGCQNPTISEIVKGTYFRHGSNHGKPVYKKKLDLQEDVADDDDLDVLIYYWDERDGDDNCGWWFSPSVGGEMVWAYHPSRKATTPPPAEWNVPHDGPIDKSFSVTAAPELAKKAEEKAEEKDEDEEEEEEEEEEDEEVSKPKEEVKEVVKEPELDLTGLSKEERELAIQEAEDRRIMEQLKQRELDRKKKAEELRLKKEQEQKALEAEEKKKKKQKDKEQKKKDKEEKRREEEERLQREKAEEERRRREEDEKRRKREEEDIRRKKEEEEEKLRQEEEERERRRREEEKEREEKERRRKREEEEREREEKRRKREEEEREREERERRRKREEEEREREERERRRKREEEEREERERRRKREEEREREERERRRKREEEERRREEEEEKRRKKLKEEEDRRRREEEERRRVEEEKRRKEEEERRRKREAEEEEERKKRKLQEEKERKEEEERERIRLEELRVKEQQIREVVAELEKLLVKAEEEATKARQVTEHLYQLVNQMNSPNSPNSAPRESLAASFPPRAEEALRSAKTASRLGHVAQSACETAWKSLEQNWMQISQVESLRNEVAHFVQRSEQRMQQAQMVAAQAVKMASESMERICNTAAPAICDRKNGDIFRRYDQDEDGMLSANEVTTFARLEYGFALPKANLDRILSHLAGAGAGAAMSAVEPKRFHQLRTAVGIARFEARAKKAKEAKAQGTQGAGAVAAVAAVTDGSATGTAGTVPIPGPGDEEKLLVEFQNHLKQRQNGIALEMEKIAWKDLETKIAEVENTSASFVKAAADSVGQDELQRFEATFDAALQAARSALPGFVNQLRSLHHEALQVSMKAEEKKPKDAKDTKELKEAEKPEEKTEKPEGEAPKTEGQDEPKDKAEDKDEMKVLKEKLRGLSLRLAKLEARLVLSERKASEGRKVTARILAHKVEEVRLEVAMKLRQCIEQLGGKAVDLFQIIAKGEDVASVEEAQVFLKENNCEMEMEKLSKAFAACKSTPQDGSAGPVKATREEFTRIIRVCYEVTKEVALTETMAPGPAMRNLQVGEVLEVQAGPRADASSEGLQRIHARAQLDGALGWVTLSSSEGEYLVKKPNPTS